ncbi:MAG: hypothetical protein A2Y07_00395 [Planctomycetes bacterium GWF2_50_10]|nr:MAG: hypothetical protein A2Y07_00395 [Planctomycetes bacterium GWF2_50_10]
MHPCHRTEIGYTLAELVLVSAFLSICAIVAIPRMNTDLLKKYKSQTAAKKIITDLRLARSLAIQSAASNNSGFALHMTGSPPYRSYRLINLATDAVISSHDLDSSLQCTGGTIFNFGPLGNLKAGSDTSLVVSGAGSTTTITLTAATGMVSYAK